MTENNGLLFTELGRLVFQAVWGKDHKLIFRHIELQVRNSLAIRASRLEFQGEVTSKNMNNWEIL